MSKEQLDQSAMTEEALETPAETSNLEISALTQKIQELETALVSVNDALLREKAESDNIRRRAAKELEDTNKYAVTSFAKDLTEVLENLFRAVDNIPSDLPSQNENIKNFIDGVLMTKKILLSAFEKQSIERLHPLNMPFDHNYHQAISQLEDKGKESNTVLQVIRSGYKIKDRLLQPALVIVSK